MRVGKGIVGATLLYGPNDSSPDLVAVMQFLIDDLRADDRRISGLRLGTRSLRLRADSFEIVLTLAQGPLPLPSLDGVIRPAPLEPDAPDMTRARLIHSLREHRHALGFFLRHRGALPDVVDDPTLMLTRMGRFCLVPVFDAAPPAMLVWQPGSLLYTRAEFLATDAAHLLAPPPSLLPVQVTGSTRPIPARDMRHGAPSLPRAITRQDRAGRRSGGRLFGKPAPVRPRVLPRLDTKQDAVTEALRQPPEPMPRGSAAPVAVALMWLALVPQLLTFWPV
jgi:hypothetical protein